ncbi:MAG TPA: hypothetical protein VJ842_14315 [Pyrinomonadaceae bacterium]|nr:hypothetical protein [Pyrinomonadaceae bacterium]
MGSIAYYGDRYDNETAVQFTPTVDRTTGVVTEPSMPTFRATTNELDRFRLVLLIVGVVIGIAWAQS